MADILGVSGNMFKRTNSRVLHFVAAVLLGIGPVQYSSAEISQVPLFLGGGGVPGNLVLTPSVEYPTIQSLANLGSYTPTTVFEGYFDPEKCYKYEYSVIESERRFEPSSLAPERTCSGADEWSGNFLNWSTTQTIDPFRKVLTGGYRVRDTATETWLEKARHPGQSSLSSQVINDLSLVQGATPFNSSAITVKIDDLEKSMRFSLGSDSVDSTQVDYTPGTFPADVETQAYSYLASVRVKVCDPSLGLDGLENNCKEYDQGWKPEGLLQQNAERIRYSVFGYLNQDGAGRDGGVMRARQKYIGPEKLQDGTGFVDNPNKEWDPDTGVMYANPDPDDATNTPGTISNSGVMNYINKFGQLNNYNHKSNDPVSELYYAATRYLKNQGNVETYSSLSGNSIAKYTDDFPVISTWDDPIQFACQPNVILGIGDVNTHDDKNLPGNTTYRTDEPAMPASISSDTTVNVLTATNRVGAIEDLGDIGSTNAFTGRDNSAYIAGLAYDNHTVDMRDDLDGKQTASTHWVDVLEKQKLLGPASNQYYLAAKYGGFDVPEGYEPYARTDALPESWWHSNGETVTVGSTSIKRPDNFYIAGQADRMINSLRAAFKNISSELASSSSSVAASSTSLQSGTTIYQASFNSARWSGEVTASELEVVNGGITIKTPPAWKASETLDALSDAAMDNRNILTAEPMAAASGTRLTTTGAEFTWSGLTSAQKAALAATADDGTTVAASVAEDRLEYLRGERNNERTTDNQIRPFRQRDSRLGDIINSSPVYVHQKNFGYFRLDSQASFSGSGITSYADFRASDVYKNRPPFLMVGANDGMVHAFKAALDGNGEELFAYVPAGVYDNLWELTDPNYSHRYFVDGTPVVSDAWLGSGLGWKTLAVGTTGAGGKSVFALDVTNPESMTSGNVLWEFSHDDMGYTIQQPSIFALPTGDFGVVVSSGYGTDLVNGKVWFLNAANGQVIRELSLPTGSAELGSPYLIDLNGDRIADRMYVADTGGKVWRVDLDSNSAGNWDAPSGLKSGSDIDPLFEAASGQKITADLVAALNEEGEVMVFFGTGSFQNVGENLVPDPAQVESFYGIVDQGVPVPRNDLLEQEILDEATADGGRFRLVSKNTPSGTYKGWFMDLQWKTEHEGDGPKGERVVSQAVVRADRVIFPTLIPSEDPCAAGGRSWLMEVELYSGGRLDYEVFDVNNDGKIDSSDRISVGDDDDPNNDPDPVPPSGIDPDIGIIQKPTIVEDCIGADECKIVSGSSGKAETIQEAPVQPVGRLNWEQLR